MNPLDFEHVALWWGPGVLVLITFGWGFFRLAQYWIGKSMEMKRQQMDGAYGLVRQYIEKFLGAQDGQAERAGAACQLRRASRVAGELRAPGNSDCPESPAPRHEQLALPQQR